MLLVMLIVVMMVSASVVAAMVLHRCNGVAIVRIAIDAAPEHIIALPLQLDSDLSVDVL